MLPENAGAVENTGLAGCCAWVSQLEIFGSDIGWSVFGDFAVLGQKSQFFDFGKRGTFGQKNVIFCVAVCASKMRGRDSNPELRDMNPPCCLCTTSRSDARYARMGTWAKRILGAGELNSVITSLIYAVCAYNLPYYIWVLFRQKCKQCVKILLRRILVPSVSSAFDINQKAAA